MGNCEVFNQMTGNLGRERRYLNLRRVFDDINTRICSKIA
jgi:hypothetical protein